MMVASEEVVDEVDPEANVVIEMDTAVVIRVRVARKVVLLESLRRSSVVDLGVEGEEVRRHLLDRAEKELCPFFFFCCQSWRKKIDGLRIGNGNLNLVWRVKACVVLVPCDCYVKC